MYSIWLSYFRTVAIVAAAVLVWDSSHAQDGSQSLPESFKSLPNTAKCEAWAHSISGMDKLAGEMQIRVDLSGEPLVVVSSPNKSLNFSFGHRVAAGRDHSVGDNYCAYFYDESSTGNQTVRYFCSDTGEKSWLNNDYSSISFEAATNAYTSICKRASYHEGLKNIYGCWVLKNCK